MTKRRKPENGEKYWYLDILHEARCGMWGNYDKEKKLFESGNCFKTKAEAKAVAKKVKSFMLGLREQPTESSRGPKLTTALFGHRKCPKWAKWAALDGGGMLTFYEDKPMMSKDEYPKRWINYARWYPLEGVKFDSSDWENSLIEFPSKDLPKLTAEVFDLPDCPGWAKWAVVNSRGTLIFFGNKPNFEGEDYGCWSCAGYMYKHIRRFIFDASDWQNSLIKRPPKDLPKLTAEVFDRKDCPKWAKWAAVDRGGNAYFHEDKPTIHCLHWSCGCSKIMEIGKFDDSYWKNSLIERHYKLPDWCKVDVVGWHKRCGYFKITYIDAVSKRVDIQQVEDSSKGYLSFHTVCNEVVQSNHRPYNEYEMEALVGKSIKTPDGTVYLCSAYQKTNDAYKAAVYVDTWVSAATLLEDGYKINNKPCGVYEHLNEKGEWVE